MDKFRIWIGQVTTGHGFMILGSTCLAVSAGTMSWAVAFPLLVAAAVGMAWPEGGPFIGNAQAVASDAMRAISDWRVHDSNVEARGGPVAAYAWWAAMPLLGVALSACAGGDKPPTRADVMANLCMADAIGQPIVAGLAEDVAGIAGGPAAAAGAQVGVMLDAQVHARIMARCFPPGAAAGVAVNGERQPD
jgi:hypothetical protein